MTIEVIEIWAIGYKRYAYVKWPSGVISRILIQDSLYKLLKNSGIPTAQKRRYEKSN